MTGIDLTETAAGPKDYFSEGSVAMSPDPLQPDAYRVFRKVLQTHTNASFRHFLLTPGMHGIDSPYPPQKPDGGN